MVSARHGYRSSISRGGLRNIEIFIADMATLTRANVIADLVDLLRHQQITTVAQFDAAYPDPFGECPAAPTVVRDYAAMQYAGGQLSPQAYARLAADSLEPGDDLADLDQIV